MAQITGINANGASSSHAWAGGAGNLALFGDFGGGSARLEYERNTVGTSVWVPYEKPDLDGLTITKNKGFNFELPACNIRVFVVNATSPALVAEIEAL